jgi:NADH:ubiquinone oxidoreductase subunit 3 (subunit A)
LKDDDSAWPREAEFAPTARNCERLERRLRSCSKRSNTRLLMAPQPTPERPNMVDPIVATYAPVVILVVLAFVIVWATLALTKLVAPSRMTPGKVSTYESGEVPHGSARGPLDVQYYVYVLVFLVIDVEAAFLIPMALHYTSLGVFEVVAAGIFLLLVLEGWIYAWKKGALTWQS